ncbi:MAG TPA: hypothetical protein VEI02_06680 [Planctomycetota bacterium]|nr:hypothetical protein [Planctomycetota bacterium]
MAVFHPDHDALHGFTVIVFLQDGGLATGRWNRREGDTVSLFDGARCAPADAASFAERLKREGPRVQQAELTLDAGAIASVRPFGDWLRDGAPAAS